jgi:hypothetical protein
MPRDDPRHARSGSMGLSPRQRTALAAIGAGVLATVVVSTLRVLGEKDLPW